MVSDKIPTLKAIETLCYRIKQYIDSVQSFKSFIQIKHDTLDKSLSIYPNKIINEDNEDNANLEIDFNPSENNININNASIINLAAPTNNNDAVTKQYVDNAIQQVENKNPIINLDCTFAYGNMCEVYSTSVYNITSLKLKYDQGVKIKLNASKLENDNSIFNVICFVENYDFDNACFYVPIYYKALDSNEIINKIIRIYSGNQNRLFATLLNPTILEN